MPKYVSVSLRLPKKDNNDLITRKTLIKIMHCSKVANVKGNALSE